MCFRRTFQDDASSLEHLHHGVLEGGTGEIRVERVGGLFARGGYDDGRPLARVVLIAEEVALFEGAEGGRGVVDELIEEELPDDGCGWGRP